MKPRIHPYISEINFARVRALATRPGETESLIVDKALDDYFSKASDLRNDGAMVRRLDRLTRQFDRLERNDLLLNEMQALFIRYFFMVTPPIPESQLDAARAEGEERFDLFVEHLGRELRAGRRLVQRALDEMVTDKTDFFSDEELDRLHQPAPERAKKGDQHA